MYIDTHCHLDKRQCDDIEEVIKNIEDNIIIISGYDDESNKEVIDIIDKYENVYGTIGIHPSEIKTSSIDNLKKLINHKKIVGIGEIGLDYHYGKENKEEQKQFFINQIQLASSYKLPIVIHSRDAASDTLEILKTYASGMKINMHCFSYSLEMAIELLKLNVKFGIGGVLTFKNSKSLKEIVSDIDLKNFILETDSPWLTPEPFRGKKNEPKNIILIAKKISEIKNIPLEEVLNVTTKTALEQFDIDVSDMIKFK